MDERDRFLTKVVNGLVQLGLIVWDYQRNGYQVIQNFAIAQSIPLLLNLLHEAWNRIRGAIHRRSPEQSVVSVFFNEIAAMGVESYDKFVELAMVLISFLRKLWHVAGNATNAFLNRGSQFAGQLERRALTFTSVSSVRNST